MSNSNSYAIILNQLCLNAASSVGKSVRSGPWQSRVPPRENIHGGALEQVASMEGGRAMIAHQGKIMAAIQSRKWKLASTHGCDVLQHSVNLPRKF